MSAAIQGQKEMAAVQEASNAKAIEKSEKATAEKISKLEELVAVRTEALSEKIDDVKTVANATVQQKVGGTENRTTTIALVGLAGVVISIVVGVVSFALANSR